MAKDFEQHSDGIFVVIRERDQPIPNVLLATSRREAEKLYSARSPEKIKSSRKKDSAVKATSYESLIDDTIQAFLPYYHLANYSRSLGPIFARSIVSTDVNERVGKYELVKENKSKSIYKVSERQYSDLLDVINSGLQMSKAFQVLPSSVILSIVATFDAHLASMARFAMISNPNRIINSDREYKARDIFRSESFDDLIKSIIDDEIHRIMWDSHQKQVEKLEDLFNLKIQQDFKHWGQFIEVFERRNLAAHGIMSANDRYVRNCRDAGTDASEMPELGGELELNPKYLRRSTDALLLFLIVFVWNIWIKQNRTEFDQAYKKMNRTCFDLLVEGRHTLASQILEIVINWKSSRAPEEIRRMMVINLANAYKFLDRPNDCDNALDIYQWKSASDDYQICVACVKGQVDEVCTILPRLKDEKLITREEIRKWPVFHWVRDDDRFRKTFFEVFGEEMIGSD